MGDRQQRTAIWRQHGQQGVAAVSVQMNVWLVKQQQLRRRRGAKPGGQRHAHRFAAAERRAGSIRTYSIQAGVGQQLLKR